MRVLLLLGLVGGLAVVGRAQELDPLPDPYTKGDAEAWAGMGYAPSRNVPFGDGHDTDAVQTLLGAVHLLWVETDHFLIGSTLPDVAIEREHRADTKAELKLLAKRLPRVKAGTRTLDRWLRLHLYAQRLEALYADFQALAGVDDEDFPEVSGAATSGVSGGGRHLGMRGKFRVLLLEKQSSLGRYAQRYGMGQGDGPERPYSVQRDALVFATATELHEGDWAHDRAFHCHVVWGVTQNLMTGLKGFRFIKPRWLLDGLAHRASAAIDPDYPSLSLLDGSATAALEDTDWPPRIRGRVKFGIHDPADALFGWQATQPLKLPQQMMTFARVDHLASDAPAFARFLGAVAEPIEIPGALPDHATVRGQVEEALQAAYGWDPAAWDVAFEEWVLDHYPRK